MKLNAQMVKAAGKKLMTTKAGLKLAKHSPDILIFFGIGGIVGGTFLGCKNTLKVPELMEEHESKIQELKHTREMLGTDKEKTDSYAWDYKQEVAARYLKTGKEFLKLYSPTIALTTTGICCIMGSHNIMKKRNLALTAAYNLMAGHFSEYRGRVKDELGEEKDAYFYGGVDRQEFEYLDPGNGKGKPKTVKDSTIIVDPNKVSKYAKYFDDASRNWCPQAEYNYMFLKAQQQIANDMLHSNGHLFLNEVYDMLDLPRTSEGAIVGWVIGQGDDFVDFGFMNADNPNARDFINGYNPVVLLDFNVDGIIYDLI